MSAECKTKPEQMAINTAVVEFVLKSSRPVSMKDLQKGLGFDKKKIDLALKWASRTGKVEYNRAFYQETPGWIARKN